MTMYYKFVKDKHHTTEGTLVTTYSFKNIDYVMMKGHYGLSYKHCHRLRTTKENLLNTSLETSNLNNPFLILAY